MKRNKRHRDDLQMQYRPSLIVVGICVLSLANSRASPILTQERPLVAFGALSHSDTVPVIARVFSAGRCHFVFGQKIPHQASCIVALNDSEDRLVPGLFPAPSTVTVRTDTRGKLRRIVIDYASSIGLDAIVRQYTAAFRAPPTVVNVVGSNGSSAGGRWTDGQTKVLVMPVGTGKDGHMQVQLIDIASPGSRAPVSTPW
jgi:hypothetical protein